MNGTVLAAQRIMLGVSEYSTAQLTDTGLQLIENCIYYLLGLPMPSHTPSDIEAITPVAKPTVKKVLTPQGILIRRGEHTYTLTGVLYQ